MQPRAQTIIIGISIITFVAIVGFGVWQIVGVPGPQPTKATANTNEPSQDTSDPNNQQVGVVEHSQQEIESYLVENNPSLISTTTSLPVFTVIVSKEPLKGWYVLALRNNEVETSSAWIVLKDVNGRLTTVAGPGTGSFNNPDLPLEVRKAMRE